LTKHKPIYVRSTDSIIITYNSVTLSFVFNVKV